MAIAATRKGGGRLGSSPAKAYGSPKGGGKGWSLFGGKTSKSGSGGSYRPAPVKNLAARTTPTAKVGNKAVNNKYRPQREPWNLSLSPGSFAAAAGKLTLLAMMLVFLGAVSVGLLMSYRYMTNLPYFTIQQIAVEGTHRLTEEEVVAACGVDIGHNSLAVNMHDMEASLIQSPWIATVAVKRILPDKLTITVTERQPYFWVKKDDKVYYADDTGQIIAPVEPDKFASLPILEVEGEETVPRLDMLPEMLRHIESQSLPFGLKQAAWMKLSAKNGIEFYLDEHDITVSAGLDDWRESFTRLSRVWSDLVRRKELAQVKTIRAAGSKVIVYKRA